MISYDEQGNLITELHKMFEVYDKGEYIYDEVQGKILQTKEGELLPEILSSCTICPVNNGTCPAYFEIAVYGYNPDKGNKRTVLRICPNGTKDISKCMLSK